MTPAKKNDFAQKCDSNVTAWKYDCLKMLLRLKIWLRLKYLVTRPKNITPLIIVTPSKNVTPRKNMTSHKIVTPPKNVTAWKCDSG